MREHLVAYFESHHRLVEAAALEALLEAPEPLALSRRLLEEGPGDALVVTREMVEALIGGGRAGGVALRPVPAAPPMGAAAPAGPYPPSFSLIAEGFIPLPEGRRPLEAYSGLFTARFRALARLLRGRPDLTDLHPVKDLGSREGSASIIGMIRDVRRSPEKHHLILTVEDESGSTDVLLPRDHPLAKETFLPDEVIGIALSLPRERGRIAVVRRIVRPDVSLGRTVHRADHPSRALFLSDLHIGSRSFLAEEWARLVDFLREKDERAELARSVSHVVIAGDLVDGIGVYPNQERELAIGDIVEQYRELGRRLSELPERLNIVALPGNHDAVCPAEPQPALPSELTRSLPRNVRTVGNPATFALDGVVVEAYHGRSFDDLIPAIPGARYARPTEVMKRMLEMRHLAPIYGGRTPLAPLLRDGLVIDPAPDILVTGHAHTYGVDQHRGVLLLNASTWQAMTEYQRMRNITPVPAHAAAVNLAAMTLETLDFSGGTRAGDAA